MTRFSERDADVIVVGAGPAGAATAYWCATAGCKVLVLEKAAFPRDKVCGDGLTPRAIAELARMGVDLSVDAGFVRNVGLRISTTRRTWELPWPDVAAFPSWGSAMSRRKFDHLLIQHAIKAGAELREQTRVTAVVRDEQTSRVIGVVGSQGPGKEPVEYHADVVVACDGASSRLATTLGILRRENRPIGAAHRAYFQVAGTPRADDAWMESHLELWSGIPGKSELLPGYGWIFNLGDGTANVGLGSVVSSARRAGDKHHNFRHLLDTWVANAPEGFGLAPANQLGRAAGHALPMAFNRASLYCDGVMLAGDAAGMISPFNGEGIAYALMAGRYAADAVVQGVARNSGRDHEIIHCQYQRQMRAELGGYYTLGRAFVRLIEHPAIMAFGACYALPVPVVRQFVVKLLSDCYEPRGGDWMDRTISLLTRIVPKS